MVERRVYTSEMQVRPLRAAPKRASSDGPWLITLATGGSTQVRNHRLPTPPSAIDGGFKYGYIRRMEITFMRGDHVYNLTA